jgi:hypothetical protein
MYKKGLVGLPGNGKCVDGLSKKIRRKRCVVEALIPVRCKKLVHLWTSKGIKHRTGVELRVSPHPEFAV